MCTSLDVILVGHLVLCLELKCTLYSEASEVAISVVAYIVGYTEVGEKFVSFVLGKSKVAPANGHTILRLERCGAVIAVELAGSVTKLIGVQLTSVTFYTDSRVALGYIHNQYRRFYTYVSN